MQVREGGRCLQTWSSDLKSELGWHGACIKSQSRSAHAREVKVKGKHVPCVCACTERCVLHSMAETAQVISVLEELALSAGSGKVTWEGD
jgi:hypothetical protein